MILDSNSASGGYDIDNSLKLEADNSENLYRNLNASTSTTKFTHSMWVKRTELVNAQLLYMRGVAGNEAVLLRFSGESGYEHGLQVDIGGSSTNQRSVTDRKFRDTSAWYHIVLAVDTTQSTAANRRRLYVNGEEQSFGMNNTPSQNFAMEVSSAKHRYGAYNDTENYAPFSGYIAECHYIDGSQLDASSFGETDDSGIWKAIQYTGSYGTGGYYLDFSDSSALGSNSKGDGTDFTLRNITSVDQASDSPTNNFCIMNNNWRSSYKLNVSNGGTLISGGNGWSGYKGSMGVTTGKWYWEVELATGGGNSNMMVGVGDDGTGPSAFDANNAHEVGYRHLLYYTAGGYRIWHNSSGTATNDYGVTLPTISEGDVIGIALNMDDSEISFYKNGSILLTYDGLDLGVLGNTDRYIGHVMPFVVNYSSLREPHVNFGGFTSSPPASGNSDANGYGNFEYSVPSGYYAICTKNLAQYNAPGVDDPSAHYQGLAYRGDSSSTTSADRNLTNTGNSDLQPDLIWLFNRDTQLTGGQKLVDSNRGAGSGNSLSSSLTNTEGYNDSLYGFVNSFNSDGFGVRAGTDSNRWYVDRGAGGGDKYVAYQWKANGGTTSTNTDGDINSTVQVNSDAGFSIVSYTPSNNTARNIGHGLGAKPRFIITRAVNRVEDWRVFHAGVGNSTMGLSGSLTLNSTAAHNSNSVLHNGATTTTFGVGTDYSVNGAYEYISYCWTEIEGFSKFEEFEANGQADGEFVYTGFRPAWVILKERDSSGYHWRIYSSAQSDSNPRKHRLTANLNEAEYSGSSNNSWVDFYSNGFRHVVANTGENIDGNNMTFAAFAAAPFYTSTGVPGTAD